MFWYVSVVVSVSMYTFCVESFLNRFIYEKFESNYFFYNY